MNQLTPEQLDMIKRLQPLFISKMGEWQEGDEYYDYDNKEHGWFEAIMPEFFNLNEFQHCFRIPKPIDWQNPERGFDGMIDWSEWQQSRSFSGEMYIEQRINTGVAFISDPFTALLKALCEQEGV